jgi:hypothetical protein
MGLLEEIAAFNLDTLADKDRIFIFYVIASWKSQAQRELELKRIENRGRTSMSRIKSQYKEQLKGMLKKL